MNPLNNKIEKMTTIPFLRRLKVKNRIVLVLCVSFLVHLLLILLVFNVFSQYTLKKNINNYTAELQPEVGKGIELIVQDIQMFTLRFLVNSHIYVILNNEELTRIQKQNELNTIMSQIIADNNMVGDVMIITFDNETYRYRSNDLLIEQPDILFIQEIYNVNIPVVGPIKRDEHGNAYIPFGQKFRNFNTGQHLGSIVIYIKEEAIRNVYQSSFDQLGYSFITNSDKQIISHPNVVQLGSVISESDPISPDIDQKYKEIKVNGEKLIVITYPLHPRMKVFDVDWQFVSVLSSKKLFMAIVEGNRSALIVAIITFICLIILSFILAKNITSPILRLRTRMNLFGKTGIKNLKQVVLQGDEISQLELSYHKMINRIQQLIDENNEEKEKQRKMELTALQSQINPHFLYNTLDALVWIARLKKQPEIEKLISSLATFFRISLHKGDKFIPVDDEILLIQSFVTVEQTRFPNKFTIQYDIDEELHSVYMLKLILQPLVENSIKHGISEKRGTGNIMVKGKFVDKDIMFTVIDDGVGFDVQSLLLTTESKTLFKSGYGLRNVDERIKLEYGLNYGLTIYSEIGVGTTAIARISKERESTR